MIPRLDHGPEETTSPVGCQPLDPERGREGRATSMVLAPLAMNVGVAFCAGSAVRWRSMKRTDYAAIAPRYDENPIRHRIPRDANVDALLGEVTTRPLQALDVACGTGNYLAVQRAAFGDAVEWRGVDASEAMLARAVEKNPEMDLRVGRAEAIPHDDGAFDYVTTSFAFHHFEDKGRALDELCRVTKPKGRVRILNAEPRRMPRSWLYHFFPEAKIDEERRYWSGELIHQELERRGMDTSTRVEITMKRRDLAGILADAIRRDGSEISILPDADYARGVDRIRDALARDPEATLIDEVALVEVVAKR